MSRRLLLLILFSLVVLTCVGVAAVWWVSGPKHGITAGNIAKIRDGMTESEAMQILGAPAGDYSEGRQHGFALPVGPGLIRKGWIADRCSIELDFDADGRISTKTPRVGPPETRSERSHRWLGP